MRYPWPRWWAMAEKVKKVKFREVDSKPPHFVFVGDICCEECGGFSRHDSAHALRKHFISVKLHEY